MFWSTTPGSVEQTQKLIFIPRQDNAHASSVSEHHPRLVLHLNGIDE
jgi:hypothetical protein